MWLVVSVGATFVRLVAAMPAQQLQHGEEDVDGVEIDSH